jgi:hypothetical protein
MQFTFYSDANASIVNQAKLFSRRNASNRTVEATDEMSEWVPTVEFFREQIESELDIEFTDNDLVLATYDEAILFFQGLPIAWVDPEGGVGFIVEKIG